MKTYIRKSIKGYYIEFPEEIDAQYWAGKIGSTYEDFQDDKWIPLSEEQLAFKAEHPNSDVKDVIEMTEPAVHQRTLEEAKQEKLYAIEQYDNSNVVNSFEIYIDGNIINAWFTPEKRSNYKASIEAAELLGIETVSPVVNGVAITIPVQTAKMALAQILIYADRCYNVTETHKAAINALETIEAVDSYNYETGYPEKLTFNV